MFSPRPPTMDQQPSPNPITPRHTHSRPIFQTAPPSPWHSQPCSRVSPRQRPTSTLPGQHFPCLCLLAQPDLTHLSFPTYHLQGTPQPPSQTSTPPITPPKRALTDDTHATIFLPPRIPHLIHCYDTSLHYTIQTYPRTR